jgi:hypothetical protein
MGMRPRLNLAAMRHQRVVLDLHNDLLAVPGLGEMSTAALQNVAGVYVAIAVRDGFSFGTGVRRIGLLAARFGAGYLQDPQYPQLSALFREDICANEPLRLSLLSQWDHYVTRRAGVFSPEMTRARLRSLSVVMRNEGLCALCADFPALFHAIDPVKTALHDPRVWRDIAAEWRTGFAHVLLQTDQAKLDYACAIAFCCGQHFADDPLWDRLADLSPQTLSAFLE